MKMFLSLGLQIAASMGLEMFESACRLDDLNFPSLFCDIEINFIPSPSYATFRICMKFGRVAVHNNKGLDFQSRMFESVVKVFCCVL